MVACISASEGSWNLIIVNHAEASQGGDKPFAGSAGGHVPAGTPLCAQARTRCSSHTHEVRLRDELWAVSLFYSNKHWSETATCKWCTGGWQAATIPQTSQPQTTPDHWGHHDSLVSSHPVLKNNSWLISNIAWAQGQCKKTHFDISSSSSPKALVLTVHPQRSWIEVGECPTNLLLQQVFALVPLLEPSREFWNVQQKPGQMFCKINLSI